MTTPTEDPTILVRGSAEHRDYLRHQAGWLKALVNGLEEYLSIAGRSLLLLFLIYTTVKAGITLMHVNAPVWLEVLMLSLQVAGVEGAVPGLTRQQEVLSSQGREKDAKTIGRAINSTRTLAILTGLEIVLALTPTLAGFDMAPVNDAYSKILLIARLVVISNFLIAMARMEQHGPKIISQAEHEKQQHAAEQEQIRLDNASIQQAIDLALTDWTQQQEQRLDTLVARQVSLSRSSIDQSIDTLSTDLSRLLQQMDTIDTRLHQLDRLDTQVSGLEAKQGEQWTRLEQSIRVTLREMQQTEGSRPSRKQTRTSTQDGLDTQHTGRGLDPSNEELSREHDATRKIIRLSSHETRTGKQPMMTERVLEFMRTHQQEPSLTDIQRWGCAKQTAVNSREAAREILRREAAASQHASPVREHASNDQ